MFARCRILLLFLALGFPLAGWVSAVAHAEGQLQLYAAGASDHGTVRAEERERGLWELPFTRQPVLNGYGERRDRLLAVRWEHRLGHRQSLAFSAGHGDEPNPDHRVKPYSTIGSVASVAWQNRWQGKLRPSLTSSVFYGDESAKDDLYRHLDRRYFGVSFSGRLTLFEKHTPFVSVHMLRSDYEQDVGDDPLAVPEYSRLTAGWDWQIQPNLRLRAGADYTADELSLRPYRYDRSRIFFSTRYDFRR
ncbi:MAG: hypothetical protein ACE5K1_05840 [Acidiferrobacterales bacterium]